MVAQEMAQSYNQLFHTSQEQQPQQQHQEFISLEELGPPHRIHADEIHNTSREHHQWVTSSSTSAHLYPPSTANPQNPIEADDNNHQENDISQSDSHHHHQQQRTYYNLSSSRLQRDCCGNGYFGGSIEENSRIFGNASTGIRPRNIEETRAICNEDNNMLIETTIEDDKNFRVNISDRRLKPSSDPPVDDELVDDDFHRSRRRRHQYQHYHENDQQQQQQQDHQPRQMRAESQFQLDDGNKHLNEQTSEHRKDLSPGVVARKRKISYHDENDLVDVIGDEARSTKPNADSKKQNHSEIEKRRRDKMNTYITELSAMVPMCHAMSRKLDKLTVLRMAVQHLKTILGAVTTYTEVHYKPAFISDQELKTLILQAAEGFVFVVGCDRGRILYVSESVVKTLNYSQDDLLGQSWFDILHPKDVAKVKEQLSSSDLSPRERLIDAKTMLPVKTDVPQGVSRLCPGARRSFFCRMKRKLNVTGGASGGEKKQTKEEAASTTSECERRKKQQNVDWKYCVIHCTGYLKAWAPAKIGLDEEHEDDADAEGEAGCSSLSCLVAIGRVQPGLPSCFSAAPTIPQLRPIEFISRHAIDGKFLFVDQRATLVLGFLPQELLGTSMYEYYHHDDIPQLAESHKAALQTSESVITRIYRFRGKGPSCFVNLRSVWKSFRNPWTKDIEYLISKNSAVYSDTSQVIERNNVNRPEVSSVKDNYDYFAQTNGGFERLISSHVEMSKIGRRIAEQVLDNQRRNEDICPVVNSPNLIQTQEGISNLKPDEFEITSNVRSENGRDVSSCQEAAAGGGGGDVAGSSESKSNSTDQQTSSNQQINRNNNVRMSVGNDQSTQSDEDVMEIISRTVMNESPNSLPSDGNDEAAMAVIMSLLEADAGLGGPVDFSGLPWPLP